MWNAFQNWLFNFSHALAAAVVAAVIFAVGGYFWYGHSNAESNYQVQDSIVAERQEPSTAETVKLRALQPLETGKHISDLPNGVYFLASALEIKYEIEDAKKDFIEASRFGVYGYDFEIQKVGDRYYLIGFVNDETYSKLASISRGNREWMLFFPNQWGDYKNVAAVPFDKIVSLKDRGIDIDARTQFKVLDVLADHVEGGRTAHVRVIQNATDTSEN